MRAIEIAAAGGPEQLRIAERDKPAVEAGSVVIEVAAAGVNRPDVAQRQGFYPPPPGASDIPGLEVAGVVVEAGDGVDWPRVGDRVCALLSGGGYAEYCTVPAKQCLPVPDGLTLVEAASLPETYFTVWRNVFMIGALQEGEVLLVHGGSSGIGVCAIQLAGALGAITYATAGSDQKCRYCETLGAYRGINYREEAFEEVIAGDADHPGVDVVLDMVGGAYVDKNLGLLKYGGRHVGIAALQGGRSDINLWSIMLKNLTVTGSTLRARSAEEKALIAAQLRERVWPLLESGRVKPVVDEVFSLADAPLAHAKMESSEHIGKLVLDLQ